MMRWLCVQVVIDFACALVGEPVYVMRGVPFVFTQAAKPPGAFFVVPLVDGLQRTPVNQHWRKACFV